jgi:hypothetical protein
VRMASARMERACCTLPLNAWTRPS